METIEKIYEQVSQVLAQLEEGVQAPENFKEIFNELGLKLEQDRNEDLPAPEATLAWECDMIGNEYHLISPPIIYRNKGVRLSIPIKNYIKGTHLRVSSKPFPEGENQFSSHPCITTNKFGASLTAIFALWDYVARQGVNLALKTGIITQGWINNIFNNIPGCRRELYPLIRTYRNRNTGKKNQEILELMRLAQAHGITSNMAHGEGSRDSGGRYYNSWFDGNRCTCCDRSYRSPSRNYPNSFLAHVKSIKHRKNAIEFLLKQRMQEHVNNNQEVNHDD